MSKFSTFDEIVKFVKRECVSVRLLRTVSCTYYALVQANGVALRSRSFVSHYKLADSLRKRGLVELDCVTFVPCCG